MPMELPTLEDLQNTYGAGSVSALQQHQQNQGLAQMYQQQQLEQARNTARKGTLENLYSEQADPLRIQGLGLENTTKQNTNTLSGVTSRRAVANETMQLTQDQKEFALKATDQDLQAATQHAQQEMNSGNPARMEQAKKILDFTVAARAAKAKEDSSMAVQKEQSRSHLSGIGMQIGSNERLETARINAGKYDKTSASSVGISNIQAAVQAGKMSAEKASVALYGAAMFESNPELKKKYEEMAGQYEQFTMQQKNAQAQGKVDLGKQTGIPTKTLPSTMGGGRPAGVGTIPSSISPDAINHLKNNPGLVAAFDAKYGQGAAAAVLNQR